MLTEYFHKNATAEQCGAPLFVCGETLLFQNSLKQLSSLLRAIANGCPLIGKGDRTLAENQRRGTSFPSVRFNHHKTDFGAPSSDGLLFLTTSTEGSLTVAIVLTVLTVNMASTLEKGEVRQDQEMEIATPTKEVGAFIQSYTEEQEKKGECRFYGSCCTVMK